MYCGDFCTRGTATEFSDQLKIARSRSLVKGQAGDFIQPTDQASEQLNLSECTVLAHFLNQPTRANRVHKTA